MTEALVIATIAGAFGVVLATWGMDLYATTVPAVIPTAANNYAAVSTFGMPALDARVLLFALATTVGTTMFFALAPALDAPRPEVVAALKEDNRSGGRQGRSLAVLVVSEVAIAVLLLAAAGLLIDSFARMQRLRANYSPDRVLTFWLRPPNSRYDVRDGPAIIERLLTRIQSVPGVDPVVVLRSE